MSPGRRDYYTLLGVPRDASNEDIRRAYHASARRFHPDRNVLPGETELFLEVQQAYEVLSNAERRGLYDATLSEEGESRPPIEVAVKYSRPNLGHLDEPQLIYALLEAAPPGEAGSLPLTPLNLCLLLDRSTSMQGAKMDLAKAAAVRILQMLRREDLFSLVAFSDRAEVLLASGYHSDLKQAQGRIQSIQTGGATEIYRGLEAGLGELRRGLDPQRGNHLILLTDGHTYGDEQACLDLAEEAGRLGVSISGFGIGSDWNDIFLDALVGRTGGNSTYVSDPAEIQRLLIEKFKALARSLIDDAVLTSQNIEGVKLTYAFRLQPEGGPVGLAQEMHLGPILQDRSLIVLLEFVVEATASKASEVVLLDGILKAVVAARPTPFPPIRLRMFRPASATAALEPPPPAIVNALARLALYRLQERARQEAAAGEYDSATRHLAHLAMQLQAQGHQDLAKTVTLEAQTLERTRTLSPTGGKSIKYSTRALVLPAAENAQ